MKPSSPAASPQSPVMVWKKIEIRQVEMLLAGEFRRRDRLAAGDAGQVGDDAFHLVEAAAFEIGLRRLGKGVCPVGHVSAPV